MARISAIADDPQRIHGRAIIIAFLATGLTASAANPRVDQPCRTYLDITSFRPSRDHLAQDLMPHRHRELHAPIRHPELFAVAKVEIAVLDMYVRMTDPAAPNAEQNLAPAWHRFWPVDSLKVSAELRQRIAPHGQSFPVF